MDHESQKSSDEMYICPACGFKMDAQTADCPNCGTTLPVSELPAPIPESSSLPGSDSEGVSTPPPPSPFPAQPPADLDLQTLISIAQQLQEQGNHAGVLVVCHRARTLATGQLAQTLDLLIKELEDGHSINAKHAVRRKKIRLFGDLRERAKSTLPVGKRNIWFAVIAVLIIILCLALGTGLIRSGRQGRGLLAGLATDTLTATKTPLPPRTPTSTSTSTPTPSLTPTPTPGIGSTQISPVDGMMMVFVPEGTFTMGSNVGNNEKPAHIVYLDSFWIDQTEVTNAMYAKCVQAGNCQLPVSNSSIGVREYYNNPQYADYPVVNIRWDDAKTYCNKAGRRLPTEAEWEKAARGTDGREYPWGNTSPNHRLANYGSYSPAEVGSYPDGASPYGVFDMAGNVEEWVADWYSSTYYTVSPTRNPTGPVSSQGHVVRGSSFVYIGVRLHVTARDTSIRCYGTGWCYEVELSDLIGFRCAQSR